MSDNKAVAVKPSDNKIDYDMLEQQRSEALQRRLQNQLSAREVGKSTSLRRAVLRQVVSNHYKDAAQTIDDFLDFKKEYPALRARSEPHVQHAKELINAVRAKRNFPNLASLSMSKQQEILDHAIGHFDELKTTLKSIEQILSDEAVQDIRSTVWVLRTLTYVVFAIGTVAFVMDFSGSMGRPFWVVFNEFATNSFNFLARFIPFI